MIAGYTSRIVLVIPLAFLVFLGQCPAYPVVTPSATALLNTTGTSDASSGDTSVRVASNGQGQWVAVWSSNYNLAGTAGTDYDIFVSRSSNNGSTWTSPALLNTTATSDGGRADTLPQLATDRAGNWVAMWESNFNLDGTIGTEGDIFAAYSADNGASWSAPVVVNSTAAVDGTNADTKPQLVTDGHGTWLAVWQSTYDVNGTGGSDAEILCARSTDHGSTWTSAALLNTTGTADSSSFDLIPKLATDGTGTWIAVWYSNYNLGGTAGTDTDIFYARSTNSGDTWSYPALLSSNATADTASDTVPDVAADGRGNWIAVWASDFNLNSLTGTDTDIHFVRSSDNGTTWSADALLNTSGTGDGSSTDDEPRIATDDSGNWVTVWYSDFNLGGTAGTDNDIFVAQSTDYGAVWTAQKLLNTSGTGDSTAPDYVPSAASDGLGNWVAVWESYYNLSGTAGTDADIFATKFFLQPLDVIPPEVDSIARVDGNPTSADSLNFTVVFTESVTGVDTGDFTLTCTGSASGTVSNVAGSADTYTVTVNTVTGDGTLRLDVTDDDSIEDGVGLVLGGTGGGNGDFSTGEAYDVDNTAPTVTVDSLLTKDTTPALSGTVNDTGADVELSVDGSPHAATNNGDGTWTLADNIVSALAEGIYDVAASASDALGNTATDASSDELEIDLTAPTLAIGAPSAALTQGGPVSYEVTYTGADTVTLADLDVTLNATGSATGDVAVTGAGTTTRTVTISNITGDGTLGISIAADTASDTAGNLALAEGPSTTFDVDNTAPTLAIGAPSASLTNTGPVSYEVTYTGADTVTLADLDVTLNATGTATGDVAVTGSGTTTRTVTISNITGDGTLGISIAADTASDTAGNLALAEGPSTTFDVDNTAPTLAIGAPSASLTQGGPVSYEVTYSGANTVTLADLDVTLNTTGTAMGDVAVTGSGTTTRTVTISNITGDGTLGISIAADTASDTAGNLALAEGPSTTFDVDNTAPTLAIGAPSASLTQGGPVSYEVTYTGADTVTLADLDVTLNTTGTATGDVAVTGSGTTTRTVTISNITGDGTLGISIAADTASDTAGNLALAEGPSTTFDVDNTAPTLAIGAPSASLTQGGPVSYEVTYTGADTVTLADLDVTLNTTGTATGDVAVTGSGTTTRTVTISNITGDGTLGISIGADTASDTAGNLAPAEGPSATFDVDNTAPTLAIGAPSAALTQGGPVSYEVTYTGADTVTLADLDVTLNATGSATGDVAVTGSGTTTRTVTISNITGDGTLGISIAADTASDTAGNLALAEGPSATFDVDNTAPTLAIGAPSAALTQGGPVSYEVTYSGANTVTLADLDVTLNTTGTATGDVAVTGSGTTTRTVTISNITGDGTLGISIGADTASDTAGNLAPAEGPSATFDVDNTAPTLAIGAPSAALTQGGPVSYEVTYTGADTVTLADLDVTLNATGSATGDVAVTGAGTTTRTVTISNITGNGTLGVSIGAGTASDAAGNLAAAGGPSATFAVDNLAPGVASIVLLDSKSVLVDFVVTFTEPVTGVDASDFVLQVTGDVVGASIMNVSAFGAEYTVTVNIGTGIGTILLLVQDNDSILDLAGIPLGGPGAGNGDYSAGEVYTTSAALPLNWLSTFIALLLCGVIVLARNRRGARCMK